MATSRSRKPPEEEAPGAAPAADVTYIAPPPAPTELDDGGELEPVGDPLAPAAPEALWEEDAIRTHLKVIGNGAHEAFSHGHATAWKMTADDLDAIAPPLTRILNRYDPTRRAAAASDPIAFGLGAGSYAWRSILQANAAARKAEEEAAPAQVTGYASGGEPIDPSTVRMQAP